MARLTGKEVYTLANALRVAADAYKGDAIRLTSNKDNALHAQLLAQSAEALALAERLEQSDIVTIEATA